MRHLSSTTLLGTRELLTELTTLRQDLDRSHIEQLQQAFGQNAKLTNVKEFELSFCEPQANGLPSILWHFMNPFIL